MTEFKRVICPAEFCALSYSIQRAYIQWLLNRG